MNRWFQLGLTIAICGSIGFAGALFHWSNWITWPLCFVIGWGIATIFDRRRP